MPYSTMSQLPPYIMKLPEIVREGWMKVFNTAFKEYGESKAFAIANAWVKKRLKKTSEGYVANSEDFGVLDIYSFQLIPEFDSLITNSENGDILLTAVLSDTMPWTNLKTGEVISYTPELLQSWAEQINNEGITLPDIEHQEFDKILEESFSKEEVERKVKQRKGLLKDVKAKYSEGKLFIQAKLDKRYKNHVEKYKSLSIEANAKKEGNKYVKGKVYGFTFTNNPVIKSANIISTE